MKNARIGEGKRGGNTENERKRGGGERRNNETKKKDRLWREMARRSY